MLLIPTLLCPKSWETMSGDETQRFCSYCKKHVHNLAALSVSERLALLSSPAASICSRYQVAIRRPAKGKEASYYRHLLKYGAGVALTGSVLLVLWEMHNQAEKECYYRAAGMVHSTHCIMPGDYYEEHQVVLLGKIAMPETFPNGTEITAPPPDSPPEHIDLKLDLKEIDRLINQTKAVKFKAASAD